MPTTKKQPVPPSAAAPLAAPNGNEPGTEVLILAEAAAYLRVREADVVDLVHSQELPGRLIGGAWRFLKSALKQWLGTAEPNVHTRKEAQLALAGKYKDDPDLMRIGEDAYQERSQEK